MMRSLAAALFTWVLAAALAVLAAAGVVLYLSVRQQVTAQLDSSLDQQARLMAVSVEGKPRGLEVDLVQMRVEEMERSLPPSFLNLVTMDGRVLYRSDALDGVAVQGARPVMGGSLYGWQVLADGRRARWVRHAFTPVFDDEEDEDPPPAGSGVVFETRYTRGEPVVLDLFREATLVDSFLRRFLMVLVLTAAGATAVLSLMIGATVRRVAKPVGELAARIEAISDNDLAVRIGADTVFSELAPVVARLNTLLESLEASFLREKGFTSDAAHELRTPLAGLKSTLEVALAKPRSPEECRAAMDRALRVVGHMERLTSDLLVLARLESGQEKKDLAPLDLDMTVQMAWEEVSDAAAAKNVRVGISGSGAAAMASQDLTLNVLRELFNNAVHYVNHGGRIQIGTCDLGGEVAVRVVNSGSLLPAEDAPRVFDRFFRGSSSRTETGERFGLGLSIARRMTVTMGGRLEVKTQDGGDFEVLLMLPKAGPDMH